ncbi:predicted protein [Sclerotinia sclerotiorum 1980 UF-70]|uniref:Uncharacterized protein n=1 Tax=Sclerotinia sclerotiorum (strain ATCC 18683 / 1980 / Ss-1) TaxID=665079 RepID=A7EBC7_SCLS1|nr:predicted protein [Sclerotinia sclerotiorum 1980 UF-70]EDN99755.1 predicted protein [Sclerotinia sclerotiorum 1980 UF-70]
MCIILKGGISDSTKHWAADYLVINNFSSVKKVELCFWGKFPVAPTTGPGAFKNRDNIPRYNELLDEFEESDTPLYTERSRVFFMWSKCLWIA